MSSPVVITGVGAVTPLGCGAAAFHERAVRGESGIIDGLGLCLDFDPETTLGRKESRRTDRFTQMACAAVEEALEQAGWGGGLHYDPARIACIIGTGVGGLATLERSHQVILSEGPASVSGLMVPMIMANAAAAAIAIRHGFGAESYAVISACSAGTQAIGAGWRILQTGEADAVVVGGSEAATTPLVQAAFLNAGALSPTGTSIPFSSQRDGFVLGEGAGALILERKQDALDRGAVILAEILSYAASSDAFHITAPEPTGSGASRAVTHALQRAAVDPADVSYINAHGTGTALNDAAELVALGASFGEQLRRVPVSSTKAGTGHLLGAAGAVEAVATVMALHTRRLPPTAGLLDVDPALVPAEHLLQARTLHAARPVALSTSFGFGGHNAVLVLAAGE